MPRRMLATALTLMTFASCGGGMRTIDLPRLTTSPTASRSSPAGSARVEIVEPRDGASISAAEATIVVRVRGFELADAIGAAQQPGKGHLVYYAGANYEIPVALHRPATAGGEGIFVSYVSAKPKYQWADSVVGVRTFGVQLVTSDNLPLVPPQIDTVTVTVTG